MIFQRFLARKTRSKSQPADQDALIALTCSDADRPQRLEACRRIDRLSALRELAGSDIDAGMRDIVQARYRNLLCGQNENAPPPSNRIAEISELDDQRSLEQVAASAREPEVRLAAIERLLTPSALAGCALNDRVTANRSAAAERLDDKQALERVLRRIGKKDKNVHRIARRKLKEIAEREALPLRLRRECEALCEKVERLGRFEKWVQDRGLLDLLDRQWSEIEERADEALRTRYKTERQRFLAGYESYRQAHETQIAEQEAHAANRSDREGLVEELGACMSLDDEQALDARIDDIAERWEALEPLPDAMLRPLLRTYEGAAREARVRLDGLRARRKAAARLASLIEKARRLLEQSRPIDGRQMRKLLDEADSLRNSEGMDKTLRAEIDEIRSGLEERFEKQTQHAEQRLGGAAEKLAELEEAVESGELKRAEPLFQSLQACIDLGLSSGLQRNKLAAVEEALRAISPRVRDLQKWRKWGTDTHRDGLCQTMEALETADIPLEAKTLRLHDLQMEWKGLDKSGSPVNHPLWDRFHAASDKVYACCKPYLDRQAAEREAARAEREALCLQLEEFLDQVDWDRVDWKQLLRAEREMRKGWAAMSEVEGRHRRTLERRFHRAIKRLDDGLSEERSRNQAFKRDLIAQIEALAEEPDLDRAIDSCKRLQRDWYTTVPARQKDENRLWQRFRGACDAVFARRRQQQDAYATELDENLKAREAICAEAESLADSDLDSAALRTELRAIEERWRDTQSLSLPRRDVGALNERWRVALEEIDQRQEQLLKAQRRNSLDLLARQAAACQDLEQAVVNGTVDPEQIAGAEATWASLPEQSNRPLQGSIAARFEAALEVAGNGGKALREALGENAKERAELCLHLEILACIDSPPEQMQERLAFQVDRLKGHMGAGEKDPLTGAASLLERWYLCGPAPAAEMPALEARFTRARKAIEQAGQDSEAA